MDSRSPTLPRAAVLVAALTLFAAERALAQSGATATARIGATIVAPGTLEGSTDLDFGGIQSAGTAAEVVAGPAHVSIAGRPGASYRVLLPGVATVHSGAHAIALRTFLDGAEGDPIPSSGPAAFDVGAALVLADQPGGLYAGTFDVTVAYE